MRTEKANMARRYGGALSVLAVLAVGMGASVAAAGMVQRVQERHAGQLMDSYADDVSVVVGNEAGRYRDTLADVAASAGAQSNFTLGDFTDITSRLSRQRLPGAIGVSFAVPATDGQVADVEAHWRAQGAAGLQLTPATTGEPHAFVVFNHPFDTAGGTGRDLTGATEPAEALRMARDTGDVSASRTFVLLKDRALPSERHQLSFLLTAPVFGGASTGRAGQFQGWMVMGMRGGDFLNETLRGPSRQAVAVTLLDMSSGTAVLVARTEQEISAPSLRRTRTVSLGQRTWQLQVAPTAAVLSPGDRRMPGLTFVVGLAISVLVAALAGARNRAMVKVDRATAALRKDIEHRKQIEVQLQELALHDPLTGLANRTLMHERLEHALIAHRRTGKSLAVLFVDLDGFKQVNDSLGHQAGDQVLIEVAARLRNCLRASDTVARLGGDEFAILAEQMTASEHCHTVAEHVIGALHRPFTIDGRAVQVTGSVGLAVHSSADFPATADEILHRADDAMYTAKNAGKDRYASTIDGTTVTTTRMQGSASDCRLAKRPNSTASVRNS